MCRIEKKNYKRIFHLLQYYSVDLRPYIRSNVLMHSCTYCQILYKGTGRNNSFNVCRLGKGNYNIILLMISGKIISQVQWLVTIWVKYFKCFDIILGLSQNFTRIVNFDHFKPKKSNNFLWFRTFNYVSQYGLFLYTPYYQFKCRLSTVFSCILLEISQVL